MNIEYRPPMKVNILSDLLDWAKGLLLLSAIVYCLLPWIQGQIGWLFERGFAVFSERPATAAHWYEKALEARAFRPAVDVLEPAYALGVLYRDGRGVPQDIEVAKRHLRQAAQGGHGVARNDLYVLLARGGKPEDWPEALGWLKQAVQAEVPLALCNLGGLHAKGAPGVLHDLVEARSLHERAQKKDADVCTTQLAIALEKGLGGPVDLGRAIDLYTRAANAGDKTAMGQLGNMLIEGRGTAKNVDEGRKWLRQGEWLHELADSGDAAAQFELAEAWYQSGLSDLPPDRRGEAAGLPVGYLKAAAGAGHAQAMALLGEFFELGIGVEKSASDAEIWYERASAAGEADATIWLVDHSSGSASVQGRMGDLVERLKTAGSHGHARAQFKLSEMYRDGLGVAADAVQSYVWLSIAASMNATNTEANRDRETAAARLSQAQLAEALERARPLHASIQAAAKIGAKKLDE